MTATIYAAKVTAIIDEATGGSFDYPESFENDCQVYMQQQLSVEQAAEKVIGVSE